MAIPVRTLGQLSLIFIVVALPHGAAAQSPVDAVAADVPRVRSGSPRLTALIEQGVARSPTFRSLVSALESTDGIVFVEEGDCQLGVAACLKWQITPAGGYRMLFVLVDAWRPDIDVIASAGHELRHTLEVLENRAVKRNTDLAHFYLRDRPTPYLRSMETREAVAAGHAVLRELKRNRPKESK